MRTPWLRRRVIASGIVVVVLTLLLVYAALYAAMRSTMREDVAERLGERADLVASIGGDVPLDELMDRLDRSGIPARAVVGGQEVKTETMRGMAGPRLVRTVELPAGDQVQVAASLSSVDDALADLVVLGALGTVFGACLAALLLMRSSRRALRPLGVVIDTARQFARGKSTARLRPDRPDTDIGELAAAFDEMLDAEQAARERAQQSSELNQHFLADAAHQLKTPIAGIQASAELLSMGSNERDRERLLANLLRGTSRVNLLVEALLRMARIDQGPAPTPSPADLRQLCRDELDRVRPSSHGIAVAIDDGGCSYCEVPLDVASMREAVANVLDNALRHAKTRVDVVLRPEGDHVRLTVADDGPGMDGEAAARAFERFSTFGGGKGVGLGLPIARGIAEAHGGTLVYEDSGFVFRLPRTNGTHG